MPEAVYVELAHTPQKASSTASTLLLGAVAICSGLANGYNGTVLEGTIPRLQASGGIMQTPLEIGLLEGALSMGGLVGSLMCTELALFTSRRVLVIVGEGAIVAGVLCFATVSSGDGAFAQALSGRILTGVGVGVCGLAKPLIVSELAPPRKRGLLVAFFAVGQSLGMNAFYLVDWALPPSEVRWAWRVLVALGCTPAFVVIVLALLFREQDDYWDVAPKRKSSSGESGSLSTLRRMMFHEPAEVRRNFGLILALMIGYNLSGTLIITNYASDILSDPTRKLPIVIGIIQFAGLVSAASLTDRIGRRPLLLGSCALTVFGLFAIALLLSGGPAAGPELWLLLALMVTVEYAVGAGLNPIRIVLSAELMPNAYRSVGMSLGNAVGWLLALVSLFLYPLVSSASGPAPQFAFFGCVVASLLVLLALQLPETNGIVFGADGREN